MKHRNRRARAGRKLSGISVQEAARKLNKSESTIRSWESEKGHGPRTMDDLSNMCRLYGISADWYLEGKGSIFRNDANLPSGLELALDIMTGMKMHQLLALAAFITSLRE